MKEMTFSIGLTIVVFLAGCTGPIDGDGPQEPNQGSEINDHQPNNDAAWGQNESNEKPINESSSQYEPGWPDLAYATIRPGGWIAKGDPVVDDKDDRFCTTNFIFSSKDNRTLYIGTAAHCFPEPSAVPVGLGDGSCESRKSLPIDTQVFIEGASRPGKLMYSSWITMIEVEEHDKNACRRNDFALVEINEDDRQKVHPALRYFGGPTGLVNSHTIEIGDHVVSYGRSSYHGDLELLERREGCVQQTSEWHTSAYMFTPGVPGDSGSPALTKNAQALGILNWVNGSGRNGFTHLDKALDYLHEHTDLEINLGTWDLLEEGSPSDCP